MLGLVSTRLKLVPEPGKAPVILPVIVPMVQLKLDGVLEVNVRLVFAPEQIRREALFVISGRGFTVTVMVNAEPVQLPVAETGVIMY